MKRRPFLKCTWCSHTCHDVMTLWRHQAAEHGAERDPIQAFAVALDAAPKLADAPFTLTADAAPDTSRQGGLF